MSTYKKIPTRNIMEKQPSATNYPYWRCCAFNASFCRSGVNTGLIDALVLSENLTNGKFETIQAAIDDYEKQMFNYAGKAQSESCQNEILMQQPDFSFQQLIL